MNRQVIEIELTSQGDGKTRYRAQVSDLCLGTRLAESQETNHSQVSL